MSHEFGFDIERDADGKLIIEPDTPDKESNHFYRQKGGSLYFDIVAGGNLVDGLKVCLEASKQEQCKVNYNTSSLGIIPVTPEMDEQDALNTFICHRFIKESSRDETKTEIEKIKALRGAPESIDFSDFYFLDQMKSGSKKIADFCKAHGIDSRALYLHYELAVDYAKSKGGSYEVQVARGTEHFRLPEVITKEDLPDLKKKLVLSKDDPRVAETRKIKASSRDYQQE